MSRLMSVAYTEDAVRTRIKTVTRRAGWWRNKRGDLIIKPGDHLTLCRKVMGRKPGEPLVRIVDVEVIGVRRERLSRLVDGTDYGALEVALEGFPGMDPAEFVRKYFLEAQGIDLLSHVTRVEWRYLDEAVSS